MDTIRRQAHEFRILWQTARKKSYVSKANREERLNYAKEMLGKPHSKDTGILKSS